MKPAVKSGVNLELEIGEITLRGTPGEAITVEAIVAAVEAELARLVEFYGPPPDGYTLDLDGLVLEVDAGSTARVVGERIARDLVDRWRGLGASSSRPVDPAPDSASPTEAAKGSGGAGLDAAES